MASVKPFWTVDQVADQLIYGYWENTGRTARSFDIAPGGTIKVNIANLTAGGQATAREAMKAWSNVSDLRFEEVASGGQITFDDARSGAYAVTYTSGTTVVRADINIAADFATGAYYRQTFMHELGHALGLGHAGNYNFTGSFESDAAYANDTWQYSVMSYFNQGESPYVQATPLYLDTPMLADVHAIQQIYGRPTAIRPGDTVYGDGADPMTLSLTTARARTIVDSGGKDTIDLGSQTRDQRLSLLEGTFSDVNGFRGNLAIAYGTVIENAVTGWGNDVIIGNAADNRITSGAGNDTIHGGEGQDILAGGAGSDRIVGGAGTDTAVFVGPASDYMLSRSSEGLLLYWDTQIDTLSEVEILLFDDLTCTSADLLFAFDAQATDAPVRVSVLLGEADAPAIPIPIPGAALPLPPPDDKVAVSVMQMERLPADAGFPGSDRFVFFASVTPTDDTDGHPCNGSSSFRDTAPDGTAPHPDLSGSAEWSFARQYDGVILALHDHFALLT